MRRFCFLNALMVRQMVSEPINPLFASYSILIVVQPVNVFADDRNRTVYIGRAITRPACTINITRDWYTAGVVRVALRVVVEVSV